MNAEKREHKPLRLAANNCDLFVVMVEVAEEDFLRASFTKALPQGRIAQMFANGGTLSVFCNRRSRQIDYRALVNFHKADENSKEPKMHFDVALRPTTALRRTGEEPPFAEEIFQWTHQFLSRDAKIALSEQADFAFPAAQYRSVFSLPSVLSGPLNYTENEVFENAQMVGVVLAPQSNTAGVRSAGQTVTKKSVMVTLHRRIETSAQKLLSIETDLTVLRTVALSTVRPKRRMKK